MDFLKHLFLPNAKTPIEERIADVQKASDKVQKLLQRCDRKTLTQLIDDVGVTHIEIKNGR